MAKILVAYFSATGTTRVAATGLAKAIDLPNVLIL